MASAEVIEAERRVSLELTETEARVLVSVLICGLIWGDGPVSDIVSEIYTALTEELGIEEDDRVILDGDTVELNNDYDVEAWKNG